MKPNRQAFTVAALAAVISTPLGFAIGTASQPSAADAAAHAAAAVSVRDGITHQVLIDIDHKLRDLNDSQHSLLNGRSTAELLASICRNQGGTGC